MPTLSATVREFLSQVKPFQALPASELDNLSKQTLQKRFSKGEALYNEGDPADRVWVLKSGRIQIFKFTPSGRPQAIESIGPGEIFGTLCRIGDSGKAYPCTAVAATACDVIQMADQTFRSFYNRLPSLAMGVCSLCSERLNALQSTSCGAQERVDHRIAELLMKLEKTHGKTLPFTRREIAELTGTTVETAIRVLSLFSKKGWVASTRGKITLKAPQQLQKLLIQNC